MKGKPVACVLVGLAALVLSACGGPGQRATSTPTMELRYHLPAQTSTPRPASAPRPAAISSSNAFTACTIFVERQLGVSGRDAQRYSSDCVRQNGDMVVAQVYYASLGTTYTCVLARHSNGDIELLDLYEGRVW